MNYTGGEHGIMAAIMAMTAPPTYGNQDSGSKNKQDKSVQKKNNRTHPKESFCEGCGDPGEILLSCVTCSVWYHPVCDEPPLDEEVVKDMEWKCRCCRNKETLAETEKADVEQVDDGQKLRSGNRVVKIEPPDLEDECVEEEIESAEPNVEEGNKYQQSDDEIEDGSEEVAKKIFNVFNKVIATAKTLNPVPFEIPPSYHLNEHAFPGTSRSQIKKPAGGKSKPTIVDLDNFKVPVPISVCFNCTKSCRLAPLLQCDYCPKQFHFDCLNPPLTSPPVGLWMCPLHVEPFLESRQLKSWQLSKRVRIWDMTHTQIDRSTVCLNFLKTCSRKNPPFSSKAPVSVAVPYLVPEGCGNHVIKTGFITEHGFDDPKDEVLSSDEDQVSSLIDTARKRELFKCYNTQTSSKIPELPTLQERLLDDKTRDTTEDWKSHVSPEPELKAQHKSEVIRDEPKPESCDIEQETKNPNPSLPRSDFLELLKACDMLTEEEENRLAYVKRLPMHEVYLLAAKRLEDIDIISKISHPAPNPINPWITLSNKKSSTVRSQPIAKDIIQFYCLNVGKLIKFSTQSIVIGTDHVVEQGSTTLNPKIFVSCKRLSGFHAVIFYDRSHMQWEILNYSPFGLIIDDVQYSLKPPIDQDDQPRNDVEAIKSSINKRRGILLEKARNPRVNNTQEFNCECKDATSAAIVEVKHEGSATICVGSEIQIGCLKLVVKSMETEEVMAYAGTRIPK